MAEHWQIHCWFHGHLLVLGIAVVMQTGVGVGFLVLKFWNTEQQLTTTSMTFHLRTDFCDNSLFQILLTALQLHLFLLPVAANYIRGCVFPAQGCTQKCFDTFWLHCGAAGSAWAGSILKIAVLKGNKPWSYLCNALQTFEDINRGTVNAFNGI